MYYLVLGLCLFILMMMVKFFYNNRWRYRTIFFPTFMIAFLGTWIVLEILAVHYGRKTQYFSDGAILLNSFTQDILLASLCMATVATTLVYLFLWIIRNN